MSRVTGRQITVRAGECTKAAGSLNTARDSHKIRSLQQHHNVCPSIGELVACKELLIISRAPVPVPLLSNVLLTFEKSCIAPHTSAHKYGTRKDISVLCNEGEHLEPYDVRDGHGKFSSTHCSHIVGI